MDNWSRDKPFGYLHTTGRSDLEAAAAFVRTHKNFRKEFLGRLGTTDPEDELDLQSIEDALPEKRIGLLVAMHQNPALLRFLTTAAIHQLIFCDHEQLVRGLTLRIIATATGIESLRSFTYESSAAAIKQRYRIRDPAIVERVTTHWLDELSSISKSVEGDSSENSERRNDGPGEDGKGRSISAVFAELDSTDSMRIRSGIRQLSDGIVPPDGFVAKCKELLRRETDADVRMLVIRKLVRHSGDADRLEVSRKLAWIVLDKSNPLELRDVAYQAIHEINQFPVDTWPEVRRAVGSFRFPDDIDWELINELSRD